MIGQQLLEVMVNAYLWIYVMNSMYVPIFAARETITMPYARNYTLICASNYRQSKELA